MLFYRRKEMLVFYIFFSFGTFFSPYLLHKNKIMPLAAASCLRGQGYITRHSASFIKGSMMRPQTVVIPRKEPEKQETKTTRK